MKAKNFNLWVPPLSHKLYVGALLCFFSTFLVLEVIHKIYHNHSIQGTFKSSKELNHICKTCQITSGQSFSFEPHIPVEIRPTISHIFTSSLIIPIILLNLIVFLSTSFLRGPPICLHITFNPLMQ